MAVGTELLQHSVQLFGRNIVHVGHQDTGIGGYVVALVAVFAQCARNDGGRVVLDFAGIVLESVFQVEAVLFGHLPELVGSDEFIYFTEWYYCRVFVPFV